MRIREIEAKSLLTYVRQPDTWFGLRYNMNLYRGCQHHCIYCDSRSLCYGIEDFEGEVLVKANGLDLLRTELAGKRKKGYIGTGSMNDPYMPIERKMMVMCGALEIIAEFRFPVHILTKSNLILRDLSVLERINSDSQGRGVVASFTITTMDDDLARKLEPGAPSPSARIDAMATLASKGIRTGVLLMPVLPFIQDTRENIATIMEMAHTAGARHVIPSFGMTLRDRQRAHFYKQLDGISPDLRRRYENHFGDSYFAPADGYRELQQQFDTLADCFGFERNVPPYSKPQPVQLSLL